jgi:hypothetical protein
MLEEIGHPYETEVLDYASTMKAEPYLSINPMGKVPAIQHKGKVVTEVAAICCYLADAFPEAKLAPPPADRADYYRWFFFTSGPIEAAFSNKAAGWEPTPERQRMFGYGNYDLAEEPNRSAEGPRSTSMRSAVSGLIVTWWSGSDEDRSSVPMPSVRIRTRSPCSPRRIGRDAVGPKLDAVTPGWLANVSPMLGRT